jgi:acetolactate synthase I/II/III large subunit
MKVCDFIVQELIGRGVQRVYTLQGGYSMFLNDAVGHSTLMPIYMLDERGAAFAARGEALYTGKMGVCVITSGLAQTNAISGVSSAFSDYLPMMVISGDINSDLIRNREKFGLRQGGQQDVPIDDIVLSITKSNITVESAGQAQRWFSRLWDCALTEPMGPVWLNIPLDIQRKEIQE